MKDFNMTIQEEYFSNLSKVLKEKFNNKGFAFDSFSNKDEAKKFIMSLIKQDDVITFGGSTSVNQMGILEDLKSYKNFIDRNNKDIKSEAELKAFSSDVYFCSANAVTKNGDIIAIDGSGNRVAAIIYGPKKVFLVVGRNKVCNNENTLVQQVFPITYAQIHEILPYRAACGSCDYSNPCGHAFACTECGAVEGASDFVFEQLQEHCTRHERLCGFQRRLGSAGVNRPKRLFLLLAIPLGTVWTGREKNSGRAEKIYRIATSVSGKSGS